MPSSCRRIVVAWPQRGGAGKGIAGSRKPAIFAKALPSVGAAITWTAAEWRRFHDTGGSSMRRRYSRIAAATTALAAGGAGRVCTTSVPRSTASTVAARNPAVEVRTVVIRRTIHIVKHERRSSCRTVGAAGGGAPASARHRRSSQNERQPFARGRVGSGRRRRGQHARERLASGRRIPWQRHQSRRAPARAHSGSTRRLRIVGTSGHNPHEQRGPVLLGRLFGQACHHPNERERWDDGGDGGDGSSGGDN